MIRLGPNALGFMNRGIKNRFALRPSSSVSAPCAASITPAHFVAFNANPFPGL